MTPSRKSNLKNCLFCCFINRNAKPFKIANHNRIENQKITTKQNNKTNRVDFWPNDTPSFTDAPWLTDYIFGFDKGAANGLIWSEDDLAAKKKMEEKMEEKRNEYNGCGDKNKIQNTKKKSIFFWIFMFFFLQAIKGEKKNLNFMWQIQAKYGVAYNIYTR